MGIIRYDDLIKYQADSLERKKANREIARSNGITQFYGINRSIEIAERILMLLKHSRKEMQADLFEINTKLNHK
jgi:hypothetical protein